MTEWPFSNNIILLSSSLHSLWWETPRNIISVGELCSPKWLVAATCDATVNYPIGSSILLRRWWFLSSPPGAWRIRVLISSNYIIFKRWQHLTLWVCIYTSGNTQVELKTSVRIWSSRRMNWLNANYVNCLQESGNKFIKIDELNFEVLGCKWHSCLNMIQRERWM